LANETLEVGPTGGPTDTEEVLGRKNLMLVLTRRAEEIICIGDDIRITVMAVKGERVQLGLAAPRNVHIRREELEAKDPTATEALSEPRRDV
jgi:carbon storage regulator